MKDDYPIGTLWIDNNSYDEVDKSYDVYEMTLEGWGFKERSDTFYPSFIILMDN